MLQLVVRGHKQARKNIRGVYELHFGKREAAIRRQDHRPLTWRREGAVGPMPRI
jgi:hypothetical protein